MSIQLSEFTAKIFNMTSGEKPLSVKRCLFGRPDPESLSQNFDKQERIMDEENARKFREKWSFDPLTGPMDGGKFQYELITVDSNCYVPSFYTKGYTSRKPKLVRSPPRSGLRIPPLRYVKPLTVDLNEVNRINTAKRKLDLTDREENDENEIVNTRVPSQGDVVVNTDLQQNDENAPACTSETSISCSSLLCDFPHGLTLSSAPSSLPDVSPSSINKDSLTPPSRPRWFVQSSMKDYLPNKKPRMFSPKALPRT
jgi:hypothetical protein